MKVLFISHAAYTAGAEQALALFAGELGRMGCQTIVSLPEEGPLTTVLDAARVPWFVAPYPWRLPSPGESAGDYLAERLERARDLAEYVRAAAPDVVVVNTAVMPEAVLAATLAETPVVLHAHGLVSGALLGQLETDAWRAAEEVSVSFADHLAAPSRWTVDFFAFAHGLAPGRTTVVPNMVAGLDRLEPAAPGERIVSLGFTEPNKNQAMLLRALGRLRAAGRRVEAAIVGDGLPDCRAELQRLIDTLDLAPEVELRPHTRDPDAVYREAGVAVVTSRVESFSRVCVEAMAHGRPVVATRCGGPEGIIEDGRTGFLVDVDDDAVLADRLERLLASPELRERMGRAAREAVAARFSPVVVTPAYLDLLRTVARTGGPNAPDWAARRARAFSLAYGAVRRPRADPPVIAIPVPVAEPYRQVLVDRPRTGPGLIGRFMRREDGALDLTAVIRDSWFAPWIEGKSAEERILLSEPLRPGETLSYDLPLERDGLNGFDIAPWLRDRAEGEVAVCVGQVFDLNDTPLSDVQTMRAFPTTGQDSLRIRIPPLMNGPKTVRLRLAGLDAGEALGLRVYERVRPQPVTRRTTRRLLCNAIYAD